MRLSKPALLCAVFISMPVLAQTPGVNEVKAWLATYDAAFNAKDLARLAAFYHRDVTIYEGGGVNAGWADYRDNHLVPELQEMHARADHIRLLVDCAEICATSAAFMLRGSDLHAAVCAACAEVCEHCADSCESMNDEQIRSCAQACRRCAESCHRMAGKAA